MTKIRKYSRWIFFCLTAVWLAFCGWPAHGKTVNDVTFSDEVTVGDKPCRLMGVGVREKFFVDVYYGASYLHQPTHDPGQVIQSEQPKRVVLHVVYKQVDADKWVEGWQEGFSKNTPDAAGALKEMMKKFIACFDEPVKKGEEVRIDYLPETGTVVSIKGRERATIPGHDFMAALWSVWFGRYPPSESLKAKMLGN